MYVQTEVCVYSDAAARSLRARRHRPSWGYSGLRPETLMPDSQNSPQSVGRLALA